MNLCASHPTLAHASRRLSALCLASLIALAAITALGCSASGASGSKGHQILAQTAECAMCHSDGRTASDLEVDPTLETGTQLTVNSSADRVYVCRVQASSTDGTYLVPQEITSAQTEDGQAQLSLDEGTWAICLSHGDSSTYVIVQVTSGAQDATLNL